MPKVAITKSKLDALAAKIATKSGATLPLTLDDMTDAVDDISGGGVFEINLTLNTTTKMWEPDKTFAQIEEAYNAGKTLVTYAANQMFPDDMPYPTSCVWFEDGTMDASPLSTDGDCLAYIVEWFDWNEILNGMWYIDVYFINASEFILDDRQELDYPTIPNLQSKSNIAPTESSQTITADSGFDGLSSVQINAISSSYVGSGITRRSSTDLTASGATVTAPAGYYDAQASKAVASGTEGTPTATKGTVSNHAVTVTPSVTNTAGYIAGGTHSGTGVSVSASELVSGTLNVTSSGTKDVTNYASASIPAGTVTAPSSISGTSATVSTGTNTLTLTKTVSVTPNVTTAGYISSGTAGNSSISLQASVTTKAAATIHPSTSDQTIASGTYTTGAQTIKAVTTSNLTAANIKSGVIVQIGDSTDSDCVTSVTGTYTGSSTVSTDTKTVTASNNPVSLQFTSMMGQPKMFTVRLNTSISSSGSTTYYYIVDITSHGTTTHGNCFRVGSTRQVSSITSGYSWSYSGTTLTITSSAASRSASPGAFYSGSYELLYVY